MVFFGVLLFLILLPSFSQAAEPAPRESSSNGCDRHTHGSSSQSAHNISDCDHQLRTFASGKRNWYRRSCAMSPALMSFKRVLWGRPLRFSFAAPHQIRCWFWSTALK